MHYSVPHWPQQTEEPATREEGEVWSPQKVTQVYKALQHSTNVIILIHMCAAAVMKGWL